MSDRTKVSPSDPAELLAYRLRQSQFITEFGCFAFKIHDIDELLQEACRVAALGMNTEACKILEYMPIERQFVVRAGVGWKPGVVGHARIGADTDSPAGYAFETGKPVTSNHLASENRFRTPALLLDHGIQRAINVIIRAGEECFGVLEVDSRAGRPFDDADSDFLQSFANLLGVAMERHHAELGLRQALDDQEILTQEISHRVKNSLSLVASFLAMQRRLSDDSDVRRALADAEVRVQTIAQVHDRLWRVGEVQNVDLAGFMQELTELLQATSPQHELSCEVASIRMPTDRAVSLGLLTNELVTNAFKYAYPSGSGAVRLSIQKAGPKRLRFIIEDRGVGLPDGRDANRQSLGMKVIENLGRQLRGRIEWKDAQPGTRFILDLPE